MKTERRRLCYGNKITDVVLLGSGEYFGDIYIIVEGPIDDSYLLYNEESKQLLKWESVSRCTWVSE